MKHTLRYCFVLLALATTGLFAEAATEPSDSSAPGHHKTIKAAKKVHKAAHVKQQKPKHKKHGHHKKAAK